MNNYIDYNKKAYDEVADIYFQKDIFGGNNHLFYKPFFELLISKYNNTKNLTSLELGAGTGQVSNRLSELGFETTCIEYSEKMTKFLKEKSPNSIVIEQNVLDVTLQNNTYDLILAMAFIHCFKESDLICIFNKVKNWLKKDGYFIICTTIHHKTEEGIFEKEDYDNVLRFRKKWNQKELETFIDKQGFLIIDKLYHTEITKPKAWVSYCMKMK